MTIVILTNLIELNKCGRLDDIDIIFKIDNQGELNYTGVKNVKNFDRVDLVKKAKSVVNVAIFQE